MMNFAVKSRNLLSKSHENEGLGILKTGNLAFVLQTKVKDDTYKWTLIRTTRATTPSAVFMGGSSTVSDWRVLAVLPEQHGAIVGLEGGLAARPCPADTETVGGTAAAGGAAKAFDFDPKGVGVHLCMRTGS